MAESKLSMLSALRRLVTRLQYLPQANAGLSGSPPGKTAETKPCQSRLDFATVDSRVKLERLYLRQERLGVILKFD
jgi:hypothetical protein